jgi:hypothetical protein
VPAEITLEIKIKGNDKDLNQCHPYCNYLKAVQEHGSVLCRLFRTDGYLKPDHSGFSVQFSRCAGCIAAQVEVKTWAEPEPPEIVTTEQVRLLLQGRIDHLEKLVAELRGSRERECLECKQLNAIEAGREGYLQGLEFAATIADEMTQAPPNQWGKGAKYNAEKIARICREESGGDLSWAAELKEERNRWYGKAISRQIEINKLRKALTDIVAFANFPRSSSPSLVYGEMRDVAKEALAETI